MKQRQIIFRQLKCRALLLFLTALICLFLTTPALADTTGIWVSDSSGLTISTPVLDYSADYPFEGTISVSATGLDFGANVGHLEFQTGLITSPSATPVSWSNPFIWDNPIVPYQYFGNITSHFQDGSIASYNTSSGVTYDALNTFDDLIHGGPTEGNITLAQVPVADGLTVSLGTKVVFDVHIDTGQIINVDQNATIKDFTVLPGAGVDVLNNYTLAVNGAFSNTGAITIESGGTLSRSADTTNYGLMTLNGGSLNITATFTNIGNFQLNSGTLGNAFVNTGNFSWIGGTVGGNFTNNSSLTSNFSWTGGTVGGNFTNNSSLTISGGDTKAIDSSGVLTNHGTITQVGAAAIQFNNFYYSGNGSNPRGTVTNATDGTYNLTGDGNLNSGDYNSFVYSYNTVPGAGLGTFNNAGLFEKTGGTGTSTVASTIIFNNTGTVEVDSGTMDFQGGGSIDGGNYVFSNGSVVKLTNGTTYISNAVDLSGNGTFQLNSGSSLNSVSGHAASINNLTDGVGLLINGANISANPDSPLTFSMSGNTQTSFVNGNISGTVLNAGNFSWTGGTVGGDFTNNSLMTINESGGQTMDSSGVLTNHGTITQVGATSLQFNNFYYSGNGSNPRGTITNAADGTYNLTGDGNLNSGNYNSFVYSYNTVPGAGLGTFNNAGLFEKTGGTGTSTVASTIAFNNTGTVKVDSGTMDFQGGGSIDGGKYVFSNGSVVKLTNGTTYISNAVNLSGNGTFQLNSGSSLNSVSGHAASINNLTDGVSLLINGANISANPDSPLTFSMSGNTQTTFANGNISGTALNAGNFAWTGGTMGGDFTNNSLMTISGSGGQTMDSSGVLTNHGTITQVGAAAIRFNNFYYSGNGSNTRGTVTNAADGTYDLAGDGNLDSGDYSYFGYSYNTVPGAGSGTFNNAGLFEKTGGTGTSTVASTIALNNTGTVEVDSGTMEIQGNVTQQSGSTLTGGTWKVNANSTLSITSGGDITTNQGNVTLSGVNSNFTNFNHVADNQGSFNLANGRNFTTAGDLTNSGQVNIDKTSSLNVNGTFTQTASGMLVGEGSLSGNANLSGLIEAGDAGLTINGNLTLNSDATLKFDLGSINVQGNLTLDNAKLVLNLALGNSPLAGGTQFTLLTYTGTETGLFDYNGIALHSGDLIDFGVNRFQIDYAFGDPSVILTAQAAPEPSTWAMLGMGLVLLVLTARSRIKRTT